MKGYESFDPQDDRTAAASAADPRDPASADEPIDKVSGSGMPPDDPPADPGGGQLRATSTER